MGTTYEEFLASLTDPKKIKMVNDAEFFFRQDISEVSMQRFSGISEPDPARDFPVDFSEEKMIGHFRVINAQG